MIYGLLDASWWYALVAVLILTHITIASVTIYLHRCQAHRALDLHPLISHFFRFWLWLTTGMKTKEWVAIHRKHHAKCETEEDPHSPQILGLKKVLAEGAELYRVEAANAETLERYGRGTPDDWIERKVYSRYSLQGIIFMLLLDLLLFGVYGITMWAVQMIWIPFFAAGVINGVGHYWGYRNFESPDAARNIIPIAFFIGGEELHNNHHTYPNSAKLSVKWWEFDIGWMYITLLQWLKLAKVNKVPPKLKQIPNKKSVDVDTLRAIFANPFVIMSRYSKDVIKPVLKQEIKGNHGYRKLYRKCRQALIRETSLFDNNMEPVLSNLLANFANLRLVYNYREKLQTIWAKTTKMTQRELLEALQDWCKQAETAGIEALRNFAECLKTYVPAAPMTAS